MSDKKENDNLIEKLNHHGPEQNITNYLRYLSMQKETPVVSFRFTTISKHDCYIFSTHNTIEKLWFKNHSHSMKNLPIHTLSRNDWSQLNFIWFHSIKSNQKYNTSSHILAINWKAWIWCPASWLNTFCTDFRYVKLWYLQH